MAGSPTCQTLQNWAPTDIIAFLECSWLGKHGGTKLPDRSTVASPVMAMGASLVCLVVSACWVGLDHGLLLLLRVIPFSQLTYCITAKVIASRLWRNGYMESSAVHMSSNKSCQLVDYLDQPSAVAPTVLQSLLYNRDARLVLLFLGDMSQRGRLWQAEFTGFHANGSPA